MSASRIVSASDEQDTGYLNQWQGKGKIRERVAHPCVP
jgi:hypothetical protein